VTGRVEEAVALGREACALEPGHVIAASAYLFFAMYHPGWDARALRQALDEWRMRFADPLPQVRHEAGRAEEAEKRLCVGYVSPDFRDHCQAMFMLPVLGRHDAERFEIVCYSDCMRPDAVTAAIRQRCHVWRETARMGDEQLAELIRADGIDVLVDLTMHMAGNRLRVFARKPAPVQVTWLAYPGSTGLTTIDYRLTDPQLDPPGCDESVYSEKTWRLPATFWCYEPLGDVPEVGPLPARRNGHVTFGCLNNLCKVNERSLGLWAKVMARVPGSRLHLLTGPGPQRARTLAVLAAHGIAGERVTFLERTGRAAYMAYYRRIDIALDTVPYNGHTTSLDSFLMGVPVVTLVGNTVVGRAGLSQLTNLGMTELIGRTGEEFVEIAVGLAGDLGRLEGLREGLRERMRGSVLMDAGAFVRGLEEAYRGMWREWCGV